MTLRIFLLISLIAVAGIGQAAAATLTSKVDRKRLGANETLELTVRYDGQASSRDLDFSALQADFDLLSAPAYQSSVNWINGRTTAYHSWILSLHPKSTGILTIPAFALGGAASSPIDITVTDAIKGPVAGSDSPVFLEMELDKESLYVQEQLQVTYRLYTEVDLSNPDSRWQNIDGAEVLTIKPIRYQKQFDGRRFEVVEWRYILFPNASGSLDIPPFRFSGYQPSRSRYRRGKRVNLFSDRARVEVKPQPANSGDYWLPATGMAIGEQPIDPGGAWRVGEPLTRQITITGYGVTSAQLPELKIPDSDSYRLYPDQPTLEQGVDDMGIIATRTESIAIVPTRPGALRLPPVQVQWWDTAERKLKTARLPGKTLQVLPAENETYTAPQPTAPVAVTENPDHRLLSLSLVGNLALAAAVVLLLALYRKRPAPSLAGNKATAPGASDSEKQRFAAVRSSANSGDHRQLREALLQWAQCYWQNLPVTTLDQLSALVGDPPLRRQLKALDQSLYGRGNAEVDSQWIASALKRYRANGRLQDKPQAGQLKPLYPQ